MGLPDSDKGEEGGGGAGDIDNKPLCNAAPIPGWGNIQFFLLAMLTRDQLRQGRSTVCAFGILPPPPRENTRAHDRTIGGRVVFSRPRSPGGDETRAIADPREITKIKIPTGISCQVIASLMIAAPRIAPRLS